MPKQKKIPRKELLKEPEVVLTLQGRVVEWLKANQKMATVAAAALVVVVALVVGVRQWRAYQETQAMELFGRVKVELAADGTPRPETLGAALQGLASVAQKYPNAKAARFAELERANLLYGQGQAKEAAQIYEDCLSRWKDADELTLLARQGLAYCKLATNDLAGAQKLFEELAKAGFGAGSAQLQLGLLYELQSRVPEAVAAYRKAAEQAKGPEAALAKARLEAIATPQVGGAGG
jgi:predicted negative regulator of RcsB-dependent stress response